MSYRLRDAPWWVLALGFCAYVACAMTVSSLAMGSTLGTAVRGGLVAGAIFGVVMGPMTALRRRVERRGRTPEEMAAIDSLRGGDLPSDPDLRDLARGVGERRLADQGGERVTGAVAGAAVLVLAVVAISVSGWYWLIAVLFAGLWWTGWRARRELRRRVQLLRDGEDGDLPSGDHGSSATDRPGVRG